MATTTLSRSTGSPTLATKWTCSAWYKFSELPGGGGSDRWLFGEYTDSSNHSYLYLRNSSAIGWYEKASGSTVISKITNQFTKDVSGWYHIMVAVDTTDSTAEDRFKLYINGVRVADWGTSTNTYGSSSSPRLNTASKTFYIGTATGYSSGQSYDGLMSHFHFCDGTALAQSVFGETDSTTGIWKIKTAPSFTPGNNGFSIMKDGNTITDQSANSNNFTLAAGTLTKSEDCPSNVFATLNPLDNYYAVSTFANGATSQTSNATAYGWVPSTLGMVSGKWYAECKQTGFSGGSNYDLIGITAAQNNANTHYLGQVSYTAGYYAQGNVYNQSGSATSTYASYTTGDIIGVALDLDNSALYFSKNGSWQNSGDPTSGASKTGALTITAVGSTEKGAYFFASGDYGNSVVVNNSWNFGNGYFGTTAVSSAGTNASGIGIFEYDVPSGYKALCTKGLND